VRSHRHLADAFLALSDGATPPSSPSGRRALCAVAAALVLALAAPLAWNQSAATAATKAAVAEEADDEGGPE
jgi:hypothetical protein